MFSPCFQGGSGGAAGSPGFAAALGVSVAAIEPAPDSALAAVAAGGWVCAGATQPAAHTNVIRESARLVLIVSSKVGSPNTNHRGATSGGRRSVTGPTVRSRGLGDQPARRAAVAATPAARVLAARSVAARSPEVATLGVEAAAQKCAP